MRRLTSNDAGDILSYCFWLVPNCPR